MQTLSCWNDEILNTIAKLAVDLLKALGGLGIVDAVGTNLTCGGYLPRVGASGRRYEGVQGFAWERPAPRGMLRSSLISPVGKIVCSSHL